MLFLFCPYTKDTVLLGVVLGLQDKVLVVGVYRGDFCEKLPLCPIEPVPPAPRWTRWWPRPSSSVMVVAPLGNIVKKGEKLLPNSNCS